MFLFGKFFVFFFTRQFVLPRRPDGVNAARCGRCSDPPETRKLCSVSSRPPSFLILCVRSAAQRSSQAGLVYFLNLLGKWRWGSCGGCGGGGAALSVGRRLPADGANKLRAAEGRLCRKQRRFRTRFWSLFVHFFYWTSHDHVT